MIFSLFKNNYLKDNTSLDFEIDKTSFLEKLHEIVDFKNQDSSTQDSKNKSQKLFKGRKKSGYLIIRRKGIIRKQTNTSIAFMKIESIEYKTKLYIEFKAYDFIGKIGLIISPIILLILSIFIIIKEAYPALILFIPLSLLFLIFQRYIW